MLEPNQLLASPTHSVKHYLCVGEIPVALPVIPSTSSHYQVYAPVTDGEVAGWSPPHRTPSTPY